MDLRKDGELEISVLQAMYFTEVAWQVTVDSCELFPLIWLQPQT